MKQRNLAKRRVGYIELEPPTSDFDRFLAAQRKRVHGYLAVAWRRVQTERRAVVLESQAVWDTRGRVAGYCGVQQPDPDDE